MKIEYDNDGFLFCHSSTGKFIGDRMNKEDAIKLLEETLKKLRDGDKSGVGVVDYANTCKGTVSLSDSLQSKKRGEGSKDV